jgi:hypothetical protein
MLSTGKEARGSPLFSYLNGVQVVGGSNPLTPTINFSRIPKNVKTVVGTKVKNGKTLSTLMSHHPMTIYLAN